MSQKSGMHREVNAAVGRVFYPPSCATLSIFLLRECCSSAQGPRHVSLADLYQRARLARFHKRPESCWDPCQIYPCIDSFPQHKKPFQLLPSTSLPTFKE